MEKGPLFPFSFGLSYTEHEYQALDYKILGDTIITEVKITNVGNFDADEVVQLYISSPLAGKGYPLHQLSSFKRVKLKSGETSIVGLKLTKGNFMRIPANSDTQSRAKRTPSPAENGQFSYRSFSHILLA